MLNYFVLQENNIIMPFSRFFTPVLSIVHPFCSLEEMMVIVPILCATLLNLILRGGRGSIVHELEPKKMGIWLRRVDKT